MSAIHQWELNWIVLLQGDGSLKTLMEWLSYLGLNALSYLVPLVFFCFSRNMGIRLLVLLTLSDSLNRALKLAFHQPRPYWVDSRVRELSGSKGYGLPSGHTQAATVGWGTTARGANKPWITVIAAMIILAASVSRVYLGAHFISDVVAASLIGLAVVEGSAHLKFFGVKWWNNQDASVKIILGAWATSVFFGFSFLALSLTKGIVDDSAWSNHSRLVRELDGPFFSAGEFFGIVVGTAIGDRWANFRIDQSLLKRGIALIYALTGTWLIKESIRLIPLPGSQLLRYLWEFAQGMALNLWLVFFAPWILLRLGLLIPNVATSNVE